MLTRITLAPVSFYESQVVIMTMCTIKASIESRMNQWSLFNFQLPSLFVCVFCLSAHISVSLFIVCMSLSWSVCPFICMPLILFWQQIYQVLLMFKMLG